MRHQEIVIKDFSVHHYSNSSNWKTFFFSRTELFQSEIRDVLKQQSVCACLVMIKLQLKNDNISISAL